MAKNIKLGSIVKDRISGFEGIALARHEYLTGCNKVTIQPEGVDKEGAPRKSEWFDEQQLVVVKEPEKAKAFVDEPDDRTGGPAEQPQRTL